MLYPGPRKGKKYHEVSRKIDNLAEIAGTFDKMATVLKMTQIVPELMLTEISGRINYNGFCDYKTRGLILAATSISPLANEDC